MGRSSRGILERNHEVGALKLTDVCGQVLQRDAVASRERDRALHAVLDLAHVAGPRIGEEFLGGRASRPDNCLLKRWAKRRMKCSAISSTSLPRARSGGM